MKKTFITAFVAMLLFAGNVMSQQLYFGLSGTGLSPVITNQNNYGLPFEMDYVFTMGGGGNVNIGYDFNNHLGLKLEVGWAKLGQKYSDTYYDTLYTRNIKLNYLQIPLLFKFRSGGDVAKFYIMAGPQLNMLLSASQEYLKGGVRYDSIKGWILPVKIGEETITDRFNKIDIMGRIDLGVDIVLSPNLFLNMGITMAYGFTDINAAAYRNPVNNPTYTYNASHNLYGGFNFGINYSIPLGK